MQAVPGVLPGPVRGQAQGGIALGAGQAGGHGDQVPAQGGAAGAGVEAAGQAARGTEQVVGEGRADRPGGVGIEDSGGQMRQRSVDQVGEGGLKEGISLHR